MYMLVMTAQGAGHRHVTWVRISMHEIATYSPVFTISVHTAEELVAEESAAEESLACDPRPSVLPMPSASRPDHLDGIAGAGAAMEGCAKQAHTKL